MVDTEYHAELRRIMHMETGPIAKASAWALSDSDTYMDRLKRKVARANSKPITKEIACTPCEEEPFTNIPPRTGYYRFVRKEKGKTLGDSKNQSTESPWHTAHLHLAQTYENDGKRKIREPFSPFVFDRLVENIATAMQPVEGKYRTTTGRGKNRNKTSIELWVLWEVPLNEIFDGISSKHHQGLRQVLGIPKAGTDSK